MPATTTRGREFEVSLPIGYTDTEGKLYRTVIMRKMTGKEEAILTDKKFQRNGGKLVTELLHSCVQRIGDLPSNGRGVISELYSVDRNYLLLKLRSITFGAELKTSYTCPACSEAIHLVEDLDALPVNVLNAGDVVEDIVVELEDGYLDRDGQVHTALTMRLPRGSDEEAVASQMRQNASQGKNALLARCLRSLGDLPRHRLEALGTHIMAELTMTDRRAIDHAMNTAAPGVELTREIECPHCGHLFKATLDLSNFLALD
jgi:DNA-directed RNA polymerase subunit RPC12/RpoP